MRVIRWVVVVFVVLILVLGLASCGGYLYARSATTPTLGGTMEFEGLAESVAVEREPSGAVHIEAESEDDLFFALGVAHSQDRLWQMEFQRRVGAGRLSEVLGEPTVEQDRFLRTAGFYRAAESSYESLSGESQAVIDSYVDGINAYLASDPDLPLEFRLLGYEPEEWRPADVIVWAKMMSLDLSANYESELTRYALQADGVSAQRMEELLPPYPEDAPTMTSAEDLEQTAEVSGANAEQARALLAAREALPESLEASNNWVVSGDKTAGGEPLLANDPHLGLQVPSLWHLAHLEAPGFDAVGATLPGLPAVVIGHNRDIAWGVTNVGADVQDLYVMDETDDGGGYRHDGEVLPYETRTETIEVADGEDVNMEVRETVHGPIVSDVVDAQGEAPLALRWTTLDEGDTTMDAFIGIGRSRNWGEFNEALRSYVAPSQNFVYSDVEGNIGYVAPGKFPIREEGHTGLLPVSGGGENDWQGFIPADEWPRTLNPEEGVIVTANNKATPEGYPYDISLEWAEPYRAERIRQMIEAQDDLTVSDMTRIQQDYKSLLFEDFRPFIEELEPDSEEASRWRDRLVEWDGVAAPDSQEAAVFAALYSELARLPEAEVGEEFWNEPRYLLGALENGDPNCEPATREGCMQFASEAMERAVERFDGEAPEWGEAHRATFEHPVLGSTPLSRFSNREVPFGGDSSTVNVGPYDFADFSMGAGPSYRHVVDLSEDGESVFVHPMGQSGNVLAKTFDNLLGMWTEGEYLPMRTSGYEVDKTLTLEPAE